MIRLGSHPNDQPVGYRDAIHCAVVTVRSLQYIVAGDSVRFTNDLFAYVEKCERGDRHGVADPFIVAAKLGEPFLVLVEPAFVGAVQHQFDLRINQAPVAQRKLAFVGDDPMCYRDCSRD